MACVHDPRSGQKGYIDTNGSLKGDRPGRVGVSTGLGATVAGLRTSNVVPWSPWIKRPLAARSSMSVEAGRRCEEM